jgi:cysteine desulfurase
MNFTAPRSPEARLRTHTRPLPPAPTLYNVGVAWVYLDNNATTCPAPEVVAAMAEVHQTLWANPSSVHRFGQTVRQRIELARAAVAGLIGCRPRDVVFTSGGTESNNLALHGWFAAAGGAADRCLITTAVEHAAIREPAETLERGGVEVVRLAIDAAGRVDPGVLDAALQRHADGDRPVLVSIQWANNETGTIQPVAHLAEVVARHRRRGLAFHVDATQAVGKLPVDLQTVGIDLLTLAAHKFHGPKGVGALYLRPGVRLRPLQRGGPQEREKRGGTENTAGVIGMGVAAELAGAFIADAAAVGRLRAMRDRFERAVAEAMPDAVVNAGDADRLWNTSNIGFPQLEAEAILLGLSERGVCASAGAACSSGSLEPSPVLLAMGIPETVAHGSVRFSLSRYTTDDEIDAALAAIPVVVSRLRQTLPV